MHETITGSDPVDKILNTTLSRLKTMMDSRTVFGEAYKMSDGTSVIPISKITVGYVGGGGELGDISRHKYEEYPFAGGSGACVAMSPIGFLIGSGQDMKLVSMNGSSTAEKIMDLALDLADKLKKN